MSVESVFGLKLVQGMYTHPCMILKKHGGLVLGTSCFKGLQF